MFNGKCLFGFVIFLIVSGFMPKVYPQTFEKKHSEHIKSKKIYVKPHQVVIKSNIIEAHIDEVNEPIHATSLAVDGKGLHIHCSPMRGPCGLHDDWCYACGGCGVLYCPMVCCCPIGGGG